jgi:hypothetical protein
MDCFSKSVAASAAAGMKPAVTDRMRKTPLFSLASIVKRVPAYVALRSRARQIATTNTHHSRGALITMLCLAWFSAGVLPTAAPQIALANRADSVKFAVIGDNGTGDVAEYEVAAMMTAAREAFPFTQVLMVGDNMYGRQERRDFIEKFERPYDALLKQHVLFYAALGNHDGPAERSYPPFHMGDRRFYTDMRRNVRFIALDTNLLDPEQLAWLDNTLKRAREDWIVCFFHHPLYSDARRHGSSVELRVVLEPLFIKYGVDVVFAGHDHVYERIKPQHGITHFVCGAAGQLRKGDVKKSELTAAAFDQDQSFLLVEIAQNELSFQAISRTGRTVDAGAIGRRIKPPLTSDARTGLPRSWR